MSPLWNEKVFAKCYLFEMPLLSLYSTIPGKQAEQKSRLATVTSRGRAATWGGLASHDVTWEYPGAHFLTGDFTSEKTNKETKQREKENTVHKQFIIPIQLL